MSQDKRFSIHADWRSKIHDILRAKRRKKLTGDYIQQSLDYFEMVLPHLRVGSEVVLTRDRVSDLTEGLWSQSSITKFFQHLSKTEVMDCRSAGIHGLGITLLRDLTESPWKNRRPETTPEPEDEPQTGEHYSTSLDLDLTTGALDSVVRNLVAVNLTTPRGLLSVPEDNVQDAKRRIASAIKDLRQIRKSLSVGDEAGLTEVLEANQAEPRAFYRRS